MSELHQPLDHLCRFCAKSCINTTPLFINDRKNIELLELINRLLPFKINSLDGLPQKCCETCLTCLEAFKQFSDDCIKAHEKLKTLNLVLPQEHSTPKEPNFFERCTAVEKSESSKKHSVPKLIDTEKSYSASSWEPEVLVESNKSGQSKECINSLDILPNLTQKVAQPPSRSLLCDVCGKIFERSCNLRIHKATHLQDDLKKKHICSSCGKRFSSRFQLKEHENIHLGLKPHSCDVCDKRFHKRILLRQHKLTHLPESALFECHICGLRFNRKGNLVAHEKTHNISRNFVCRVCSMPFGDMRSLLSHRKLDHPVKKTNESSTIITDHLCVICRKYFESVESLSLHLKAHEQKENKLVVCKICGQVLKAKALKYHETSKHSNDRPYQCSYCSDDSKVVGFMSLGLLKNHERLHTGQRPFKCDSCEQSFRSRKSLRQHKLKHSSQRNYECNFCLKRFKTKGTLTVHVKIHTGEKAYVCDRCGHPFIQKSDMLKHQRRHVDCGELSYLPPEPSSADLHVSKEGYESDAETDHAALPSAVALSEQVQKILTHTTTTILPGDTLIFAANPHFLSPLSNTSDRGPVAAQSYSFCSENRGGNFKEKMFETSTCKQVISSPGTSSGSDKNDAAQ